MVFFFFRAEVVYFDDKLSDNFFIFVNFNFVSKKRGRGEKGFKFENVWVTEEGCKGVVYEAWGNFIYWMFLFLKLIFVY